MYPHSGYIAKWAHDFTDCGLLSQKDLTMSSPDSISTVSNSASGFCPSVSIGPSESHDIAMLGILQPSYNDPFRSDVILKDLETQPLVEEDKIESVESFKTPPPRESIQTKSPTVIYVTEDDDNGLDCDCEIDVSPVYFTTRNANVPVADRG